MYLCKIDMITVTLCSIDLEYILFVIIFMGGLRAFWRSH